MERDRLLLFLEKLILNKENVKAVLDAKGVSILVNLLTLAHLHTARYVYISNKVREYGYIHFFIKCQSWDHMMLFLLK